MRRQAAVLAAAQHRMRHRHASSRSGRRSRPQRKSSTAKQSSSSLRCPTTSARFASPRWLPVAPRLAMARRASSLSSSTSLSLSLSLSLSHRLTRTHTHRYNVEPSLPRIARVDDRFVAGITVSSDEPTSAYPIELQAAVGVDCSYLGLISKQATVKVCCCCCCLFVCLLWMLLLLLLLLLLIVVVLG
jgi:hypothetical protein